MTHEQFASVRKHLTEELQVATTVAFTFGWRKREVLDLTRHQFSARLVRLTPELHAMLLAHVARARALEREEERMIPWLFPHLDGAHAGQRILDPQKAWEAACAAAGHPGLLIHDLRWSAVRNMEQAGVPRSVAMKLTGQTIVSESDLEQAALRIAGRAASVTFPSRPAVAAGKPVSQLID